MKARFLALAALVLGLASCQTEPEGLDVNVGGEVDTTITVSIPETTRANSALGAFDNVVALDNYTIRYIFQVFYEGKESGAERQVVYTDDKSVCFPVRLVPGRAYSFVAWADVVKESERGDWHYDTRDLKNITFKGDWNAMDETRDAFTDVETVVYGNTPINLELKRPFAKLRVITTDMEALNDLDIKPTWAEVEYRTDLYDSFNAVAGAVNDTKASKTHESFMIKTYVDNETDKSMVLFTDYIFAKSEAEPVNFMLTVYDQKKNQIGETINFSTPIPAQRNYLTTIQGNILTDGNNVTVTVEDAFAGENENDFVDDANAAQSVLDNAAPNTTVYLKPGVDYGTLYLRPVAGAAPCKEVDWIGNNYRYETYSLFENLTIVGAEGATVDAIKIEGGTYYNTAHSQSDLYPIMLSLIELKNVVIDGVTFTGKGGYDPQGYGNAINLSGNNIKVDGLTLKNCVLANEANKARLVYKTESTTSVHNYAYNGENFTFTPSLKNITITECTFNGGYMGLELRETENVTITNNEFNVADRNILLAVNTGCTYSGNITITGNVSNNAKERFVRMSGAGNAVVVIKDNTIINYLGEDTDYIKVTDGNNVTIENNTFAGIAENAEQFETALRNGENVVLAAAGEYTFPANLVQAGQTIICQEGVIFTGQSSLNINGATVVGATFKNENGTAVGGTVYGTFKNCTFEGHETLRWCYTTEGQNTVFENCVVKTTKRGVHFDGMDGDVTFKNCEINGFNAYSGAGTMTFEGCTFGNDASNYNGLNIYSNTNIVNCTFNYISGKTNFIDMEGTGKTLTITNCTATLDGAATNVADLVGGSKLAENTVVTDGAVMVKSAEALMAALANGGNIVLAANIAMTEDTYQNVDVTIDGNGYTISQVEGSTNNYALFDSVTGKITLKNIKFAGIKGGAVLRTIGAETTIENVTIEGAETTQQQGLLRLVGKSTIKNSTFKNNTCSMVITLNYDGANNDPQVVENCVFENNTCNSTAVLYYVKGASGTINGNKFIGNTVNCNSNGATVYMGFTENNVVTNNLFQNNTVNEAAESSRVAGGVFFGYETVFTGNAFVNNHVTGTNAKGNDVCVSTYYTDIDLSGNYWGGQAPVEDVNYFVQHKTSGYKVLLNNYLTVNPFN